MSVLGRSLNDLRAAGALGSEEKFGYCIVSERSEPVFSFKLVAELVNHDTRFTSSNCCIVL